MFRKVFISLVVAGSIGMTSAADAKHRHHRHHHGHGSLGDFPFIGFGFPGHRYPAYCDDSYAEDCGYRWVKVKRWNKSHTHRVVVYKKRWTYY